MNSPTMTPIIAIVTATFIPAKTNGIAYGPLLTIPDFRPNSSFRNGWLPFTMSRSRGRA
jgi:hypothetical protein